MNTQSSTHSSTKIRQAIQSAVARLTLHSETPSLDAQTILAHILRKPRAWILAHPETELSSAQKDQLAEALRQLESGLPLPYYLGHWEFYGLDFEITPQTLIPRPETELLVEQAIAWLQARPHARRAADVGTGSGCIAVSLAVHIPDLHILATDISAAALKVARANAEKHQVSDQIDFIEADLLPALCPPLPAIFANLPYIPTQTLTQLDIFEKEPTLALDGGPDGLTLIRRLLPMAVQNLASKGLLLLEIEAAQGETAIKLAHEHFPTARIDLLQDLAGHDRLIHIQS